MQLRAQLLLEILFFSTSFALSISSKLEVKSLVILYIWALTPVIWKEKKEKLRNVKNIENIGFLS
tara:strand:+ start:1173 stop:1367 length:195 start_codon:yes stop_codon:yes gene_type:complete